MASSNVIANYPVTVANTTNAREIFGPDLPSMRGKTVRCTPAPVVADYVAVPRSVVERNKIVMLAANIYFVHRMAFLITLSRNIKFLMANIVPVQTVKGLVKHLERVLHVYGRAGITVRTNLMGGEFEKIRSILPMVECSTTAAKKEAQEQG
jgi:hypothetical protein